MVVYSVVTGWPQVLVASIECLRVGLIKQQEFEFAGHEGLCFLLTPDGPTVS